MPSPSTAPWSAPAEFDAALNSIRQANPRPEVVLTEIAAPKNIAPHAFALAADVSLSHHNGSELGTGRFVLFYDDNEPEAWGGPFRVVCFAQAPLDTEIGLDPLITDVTWSWLIDALKAHDSQYTAASGTATRIISTGFGELAQEAAGTQIELRASWSPRDHNIGTHIESWAELLCMLAGLPPHDRAENVSVLSARRAKRD